MEETTDELPATTDYGPPDRWHPIYDSVKSFLANEAKPPEPGTPPIRSRNKRKNTTTRRRT